MLEDKPDSVPTIFLPRYNRKAKNILSPFLTYFPVFMSFPICTLFLAFIMYFPMDEKEEKGSEAAGGL